MSMNDIPPDELVTLGGKKYRIAALPIGLLKKLIAGILANNLKPPEEQFAGSADLLVMVISSIHKDENEDTLCATAQEVYEGYRRLLKLSGLVVVDAKGAPQPGEVPAGA